MDASSPSHSLQPQLNLSTSAWHPRLHSSTSPPSSSSFSPFFHSIAYFVSYTLSSQPLLLLFLLLFLPRLDLLPLILLLLFLSPRPVGKISTMVAHTVRRGFMYDFENLMSRRWWLMRGLQGRSTHCANFVIWHEASPPSGAPRPASWFFWH